MNRKFISLRIKITTYSIILLGLAACSSDSSDTGSPIASYIVKGTVVNKSDLPIENIRAVITFVPVEDGLQTRQDTTYTDEKGYFELSKHTFPKKETMIAIELADTDGDKNGKYKTKTETIIFKEEDLAGSNSWDDGIAIKDLGRIVLNENNGPIINPDL